MTDNIYTKKDTYYELKVTNRVYGEVIILFDIEDYKKVSEYKWYAKYDKHVKSFYLLNINGLSFHRLIMDTPSNLQVDHINRNTLDNRKCNLRNCTALVNNHNRGEIKYTNKSTGIVHISKTFVSTRNKYYYSVNFPNCKHNLFSTIEKAINYLNECKEGLHRKENN